MNPSNCVHWHLSFDVIAKLQRCQHVSTWRIEFQHDRLSTIRNSKFRSSHDRDHGEIINWTANRDDRNISRLSLCGYSPWGNSQRERSRKQKKTCDNDVDESVEDHGEEMVEHKKPRSRLTGVK